MTERAKTSDESAPARSARHARAPEVLAPAGDRRALTAALAAGADAVYLGLDEGFNARARAENFSLETLPEVVAEVHRAGARLYVTLNTLVFESELPHLERVIRGIADAGADALIVQDFAVALLARAVCPCTCVFSRALCATVLWLGVRACAPPCMRVSSRPQVCVFPFPGRHPV